MSAQAALMKPTSAVHPQPDQHGKPVVIARPSLPTPAHSWHDLQALACTTPGHALPASLNGVALSPWHEAPGTRAGWETLAQAHLVEEPPFPSKPGARPAAGVVVREPCGRVWVVAPTNGFGGYSVTFPKGKVEAGASLQATALQEAFEESGLRVRLLRFLMDVPRSTSLARYYLAERVGGHPSDMGWESQAVLLVPPGQWSQVLTHPNDAPLLEALRHV